MGQERCDKWMPRKKTTKALRRVPTGCRGSAATRSSLCISSDGMPLEDIADLVGYKGTLTTETVYRKVIVPELRRGAEAMDRLFS
jgi:hypothetical protein